MARHPNRPTALDYISRFDRFDELHGDRQYRDDPAIVGGFALLRGRAVMAIGQQRGRDTKENLRRNFGMPAPEGYRKVRRLANLASRLGLPVVTLVDTKGADPGISRKSTRNPKRSRVVSTSSRRRAFRSSPPSSAKAARAGRWRWRSPITLSCSNTARTRSRRRRAARRFCGRMQARPRRRRRG